MAVLRVAGLWAVNGPTWGENMKILRVLAVALIASTSLGPSVKPAEEGPPQDWDARERAGYSGRPFRVAQVVCFLTGEQMSGMNKICYYDCLGSAAAITIGAAQLCPLSIRR